MRNRIGRVLMAAALMFPLAAAAAAIDERLQDCRATESDAERLACYDALADGVETGEVVTRVVVEKNELPAEIRGKVVELSRRPRGQWIITLDNGQVWLQKNADRTRIEVGDEVTIRRGVFGARRLFTDSDRGTAVSLRR